MDVFDELNQAIERNESFVGSKLNEEAAQKLTHIKDLCDQYKRLSAYSQIITPYAINTERNAFVTLIQPLPLFLEDVNARDLLTKLILYSDSVVVANSDKGLSLSFCVNDIWE